jgi:hypothetical protein
METIKTFSEYKSFITTSSFWADASAIRIIEKKLNVKMIIISQEKGTTIQTDIYNIIECGYSDDNSFKPDYYIITCYDGSHYRLITYRKRNIFRFTEIPYHLKILIVKKCLEGNSGIFYLIEDFRDFKFRLLIEHDNYRGGNNNTNRLTFHQYSKNRLPGKGTNEMISNEDIHSYSHLHKYKDWRKILDDSYEKNRLITIDNRYWKSVEHYLLACPYKKRFDELYLKFSQSMNGDQPTDISDSLMIARKSIQPNGVLVDGTLVHGICDEIEKIEERKKALQSKFTNPDCRDILLATNDALLYHFISGKPPEQDLLLMEIRNEKKKL